MYTTVSLHTILVCLQLSLDCVVDEGVYVDTYGKISKNVVLQWGEPPTSVGVYCQCSYLVIFKLYFRFYYAFLFLHKLINSCVLGHHEPVVCVLFFYTLCDEIFCVLLRHNRNITKYPSDQ